ncbi:MAG TPA: ATP synthase subunit I [Coriobacteriia bacterium]
MNDLMAPALAWLAGGLLGTLFFGGLWWTTCRGVSAKQPALWFLLSTLLRTSIVLAGFYLVAGRHWERLLWCLLGFVMARLVVVHLTRPAGAMGRHPPQGASHAS